jgi:hypothetical protein
MMPKDLKELLRAFNEFGVKYLIVGGYAFGAHAEPRATKISTYSSLRMSQTAMRYIAH